MKLNFKRAFTYPFNSKQSLINVGIGSLISLPMAWMQTHQMQTANFLQAHGFDVAVSMAALHAVTILCFLAVLGYGVRLLRAEFSSSRDGSALTMPSWGGSYKDMAFTALAMLVGGTAVFAAFMAACLVLMVPVLGGSVSGAPGALYASLGAVILLSAMPVAMFFPVLEAHYASEDKVFATLQWGQICGRMFRSFWRLLGVMLLMMLLGSFLNGIFFFCFALQAAAGFVCLAITQNLIAQCYSLGASKSGAK